MAPRSPTSTTGSGNPGRSNLPPESDLDGAAITPHLTGAAKTMLVTLYSKHRDFISPTSILSDPFASRAAGRIAGMIPESSSIPATTTTKPDPVVLSIPDSFNRMPRWLSSILTATISSRARHLDKWAAAFISKHRDTPVTVLHLGCGLDARALRLAARGCFDGFDVRWIDVDVPDVADLRRRVMDEPRFARAGSYTLLGLSVSEMAHPWLETRVPSDRPTLIVAEGLTMYLTPEDGRALVARLTRHFAPCGGEIALDVIAGWALGGMRMLFGRREGWEDVQVHWGLSDPNEIERLGSGVGMRLVDRAMMLQGSGIERTAWPVRVVFWLCSWVPWLGWVHAYWRFEFGRVKGVTA